MPPLPPGLVLALLLRVAGATGQIRFHAPLFASGMILQRDAPTKIWGNSTNLDDAVTVYVLDADGETVLSNATAQSDHATGAWVATLPLPGVPAKPTTQVMAMDSDGNTAYLESVAWGDVLLCGGQSNMGFGMCGATVIATGPSPQTPTQALAALPTENPLRFYNQQGDRNGGAGSTVKGNVCSDPCTTSNNRYMHWYNASKDNAGSASAVCLLTAQKLRASLGGMVPVGAVESCVGGTPVAPWTPPSGSLYTAHIEPLLPMRFLAALWDQGERDAKTTNTTWYSTEFPAMIQGWRAAFESECRLPLHLLTHSARVCAESLLCCSARPALCLCGAVPRAGRGRAQGERFLAIWAAGCATAAESGLRDDDRRRQVGTASTGQARHRNALRSGGAQASARAARRSSWA